jgi:hypothetical protein
MSILIYAVPVLLRTKAFSFESGAYLFTGLVGLMAFGNQRELSRKVAALEEQVKTARRSSA